MAEKEGGYNPYDHREVKRPNTNFETSIHILRAAIGTGILAIPEAFSNVGWVVGVVGTVVLGVVVIYCLDILLKGIYLTCQRERVPLLTYGDAMKAALTQGPGCMKCFSQPAPIIIDIFMCMLQMGVSTVYVVFIGQNLKQVCDPYVALDERIWMAILFIPILAMAMIPDLKKLAPLSIVGNILALCGISMIMYYISTDLPPLKDREMAVNFLTFPLFVGTVLFSLQPVGVIVTVETNMQKPGDLGGAFGVMSLSLLATALLYACFGFVGFWKYGQECQGSITLNLPRDEWIAHSVRIIYMASILVTIPLQGYVPIDIIWNQRLSKKAEGKNNAWIYEYIVRIICVTLTTLLAIAIPRLALVISFIGAFCLTTLGFIFPGILDICIHWPDRLGRLKYIFIRDIILILFGFVALLCGTLATVRDLIKSFDEKGEK